VEPTNATVDLAALLAALAPRPVSVVRDGAAVAVATEPDELVVATGEHAFTALDRAERDGFWCGFLSYDLGRAVERVEPRTVDDLRVPDLVLARHDARVVLEPDGRAAVVGRGPARGALTDALWRARRGGRRVDVAPTTKRWQSSLSRQEHAARVHAIKDLLRAGECYQVNLTRRLTLDERVDPVALFAAVHARQHAPHEALLTFGPVGHVGTGLAIVSASPELFLRTRGRDVETRPIKGTARDAGRLRQSAKDHAENVMIVDLARNDLGRVCEPGSISVPALCAVEPHPGLHHLVSTVRGRRRADVPLGALVRAMFPAASITGAPKPRVMQVIEDLEPVRRGVYCGAIGWVDAARQASEWSVAIRTFQLTATQTHFGTGGGIVVDSDAGAEWDETELKADKLLQLVATATPAATEAASTR
jgi:para-aminobenzoate synthetase component 1